MANDKKSKIVNRYSGIDSVPWKVVDTSGKQAVKDSYPSFKEANNAAENYTNATGLFAGAVRS